MRNRSECDTLSCPSRDPRNAGGGTDPAPHAGSPGEEEGNAARTPSCTCRTVGAWQSRRRGYDNRSTAFRSMGSNLGDRTLRRRFPIARRRRHELRTRPLVFVLLPPYRQPGASAPLRHEVDATRLHLPRSPAHDVIFHPQTERSIVRSERARRDAMHFNPRAQANDPLAMPVSELARTHS